MDKTIPKPAAMLLDFIGKIEAPKGYNTIFGNRQGRLSKPITKMTIDELLANQRNWSSKRWVSIHWKLKSASSAAGFYQIMRDTLIGLKRELKLTGNELFDADMQDRLGFHLLKRRGYELFVRAELSLTGFALRLAMEWASFPVLAPVKGQHRTLSRGQSYYAGDGLNKALVAPERVEKVLSDVLAGKTPMSTTKKVAVGVGCGAGAAGGAVVAADPSIIDGGTGAIVNGAQEAQSTLEQINPVIDTISSLGTYGVYVAGAVVGCIVLAAVGIALYKWAKQ